MENRCWRRGRSGVVRAFVGLEEGQLSAVMRIQARRTRAFASCDVVTTRVLVGVRFVGS